MKILQTLKKLLSPPGHGVFTVHTASKNKEALHQMLYQTTEREEVQSRWEKEIEKIASKKLLLLGVCSDSGGGIHRGANWGPLFLREHLYRSHPSPSWTDLGDIKVIPHLLHDKYLNQETIDSCRMALYQDPEEQLPVSPLSITELLYTKILEHDSTKKLLSLGGDHSVSYPLVKAYLESAKKNHIKAGLLHFDAHTDLLDTRLGIDICFASWVYHILPLLEAPNQVAQVGIRSSAHDKDYWREKTGVEQYWAQELKDLGADKIAEKIEKQFKNTNITHLYVSVDIDALDMQYAPATGTPEEGGLSPHEIIIIIRKLSESFLITGADLVEVAPLINPSAKDYGQVAGHTTLQSGTMILNALIDSMEEKQT